MLKKLSILALAALIAGCSFFKEPEKEPIVQNDAQVIMQNSFNEEQYVWESFQFPTNRTSGIQ